MNLLHIAAALLDSIDSDLDYLVGGVNVARSNYYTTRQELRIITFILLVICIALIAVKYFFF